MKALKRLTAMLFAFAFALTAIPAIVPVQAEEVTESITTGKTLTSGDYRLDADINSTLTIEYDAEVTIDLNGHKISTENVPAIDNKGLLTIDGEGEVSANSAPVVKTSESLTIINGNYISNSDEPVISNSATVAIVNGTFKGTNIFTLENSNANVVINDGTFIGSLNISGDISEVNGGTFSSKISEKIPYEEYPGYERVVTKNSDGTFTYEIKPFYEVTSKTKVKYRGKTYKVSKSGLDKKGNLIYLYKNKAYRANSKGKKKLLTKNGKKLHLSSSTGFVDYITLNVKRQIVSGENGALFSTISPLNGILFSVTARSWRKKRHAVRRLMP